MPNALLIISQPGMAARELNVTTGAAISIGRALDNVVCLEDDPNISRYHAVIDARADGFYLSDLGSSNGTTIGEQLVTYEYKLRDGELVVLGGSATIEFRACAAQKSAQAAPISDPSMQSGAAATSSSAPMVEEAAATPPAETRSKTPIILIAGICLGLVLIIAAGTLYATGMLGGGCAPAVRIIAPESGATVHESLRIRVESENTKCIQRVTYQLNGSEVASAEAAPYHVTLKAGDLDGFPDGNHILTVTVEDDKGKKKLQPDEILLAFEKSRPSEPNPTPASQASEFSPVGTIPSLPPPVSGIDISGMSAGLASQISGKSGYRFDGEFAVAIRAHTAEYRQSGYTDRARPVRHNIRKAYNDRDIKPLVGFVLAMSRSKLNANAGASDEGVGLWRIPPAVAQDYLAPGEAPAMALVDPKRSAEISSSYLKSLIDVFEMDDFMYAVACFGMPLREAGEMRTKLASLEPAARRDFWQMVKLGIVTREQADRVERFFAAGIVGENPEVFALPSEQRFSSL